MLKSRNRRISRNRFNQRPKNQSEDLLAVFMGEIGKISRLTLEEEYALAVKAKNGNKLAKKKLIESNLRLVIYVAKKFFHQSGELSCNDLVQEGVLGLIDAVEKFDPEMGNKFSTFAYGYVKFYIMKALKDKSRAIRIPTYIWGSFNQIKKVIRKFERLHGREPTFEEISEETGIELEKIQEIMLAFQNYIINLNDTFTDDDGNKMLIEEVFRVELESVDMCVTDEDRLIFRSNLGFVLEILEELPPREKKILKMRFGLDDDNSFSLQEIGKEFGFTRERIRQLQELALRKIRNYIAEKEAGEDEK